MGLKITRFSGQKIIMKGADINCTVTMLACTDEMCRIYNAPFVCHIENKNLSVVYAPIQSGKMNKIGKMEFRITNTNNGQATFYFGYTKEECPLILRAELICRNDHDVDVYDDDFTVLDDEIRDTDTHYSTPELWKEVFVNVFFDKLGGGRIPDSVIRQDADINAAEFIDSGMWEMNTPQEAAMNCLANWD